LILKLPTTSRTRVRDLKGRRLAVAVRPKAQIDFWRATTLRAYSAALKLEGLDEHDVELVELEQSGVTLPGAPARGPERLRPESSPEVAALLRGEVDAIFHKGSRGLELAQAIGATVVFDLGKHPDPKVRVNNGSPRTLTVDAGLLEENLDLAVRLVKRVVLAGRWAEDHPDEAADYVATETRSSRSAVLEAYGRDVHQHLRTDLEESSIVALGDFKDFLFERKLIPSDFDVRSWIDPRPLNLALAQLATTPKSRTHVSVLTVNP
jgi:ABC-type nitrate/sulfonate/bicarbonate transport system substrate-binding protein